MNPLEAFLLFLKASLFSTGGMGNVPSLHNDLLERGWATDRQFAESMAVGQVAPGPNGLWVLSLGYLMDGVRGALLALTAIVLPPLLVLLVDRLYHRVKDVPAMDGFVRGLSLAMVGIFPIVLAGLLLSLGLNTKNLAIVLAGFFLGFARRIPALAVLTLAGLAGVLWK